VSELSSPISIFRRCDTGTSELSSPISIFRQCDTGTYDYYYRLTHSVGLNIHRFRENETTGRTMAGVSNEKNKNVRIWRKM
jgi:hypothetical protein